MMRFPDGSKICFVGDSLTAHNEILSRIVDKYNKSFPNENIEFFNCGTSGGTIGSALDFFYDDVLSHSPTHTVIAFGINDSERWHLESQRSESRLTLLKKAFERYKDNVIKYCEILKSHGIKIILCTPAPYDEYSNHAKEALKGGYSLMLGYSEFIRSYAKENGFDLCDYNKYLSDILAAGETLCYNDDRIHPNAHGYYLMARCFIEFQGMAADQEADIPEYLASWRNEVRKLRIIFGAEHMIVRNYKMPTEEKMKMMRQRIEDQKWGQPVFEGFIRGFVAEKLNQDKLYKLIDEIYAEEIKGHYSKYKF